MIQEEDWQYGGLDVVHTRRVWTALRAWPRPPAYELLLELGTVLRGAGVAGLRRDDTLVRATRIRIMRTLVPLRRRAAQLVRENLRGWGATMRDRFSLASDAQLIAVLYGSTSYAPCPVCADTGVEVVQWPHTAFRWGKRNNTVARAERPLRTRRCGHAHMRQGLGLKAYIGDTGNPSVAREKLGRLIARELKRRAPAARLGVELAQLRLAYAAEVKVLQELNAQTDPAARIPFELSIAGTDTGRLSGSKNPFGEGRNPQNLDHRTRKLYIPDDGCTFVGADLSKAESHVLAGLAQDQAYLDAHEGEVDTHAQVAQWVWPDLDWPADPREWKSFATRESFTRMMGLPYSIPDDNLRAISKRIQHALPRGQTAHGTAILMQCTAQDAERVQQLFMDRLPVTMAFIADVRDRLARGEVVHIGAPEWDAELYGMDMPALRGPAVVVHCGGPLLEGHRPFVFWKEVLTDPRDHKAIKDTIAFALQQPVAMQVHAATVRWSRLAPPTHRFVLNTHDGLWTQAPMDDVERARVAVGEAMVHTFTFWRRPLTLRNELFVRRHL